MLRLVGLPREPGPAGSGPFLNLALPLRWQQIGEHAAGELVRLGEAVQPGERRIHGVDAMIGPVHHRSTPRRPVEDPKPAAERRLELLALRSRREDAGAQARGIEGEGDASRHDLDHRQVDGVVRFGPMGACDGQGTAEPAGGAEAHGDDRVDAQGVEMGKEVDALTGLGAERTPPDDRQPVEGASPAGLLAAQRAEQRQQLAGSVADMFRLPRECGPDAMTSYPSPSPGTTARATSPRSGHHAIQHRSDHALEWLVGLERRAQRLRQRQALAGEGFLRRGSSVC